MTKPKTIKTKQGTYDSGLDKYEATVQFPVKLALAKQHLNGMSLPDGRKLEFSEEEKTAGKNKSCL